MIKSSIKTEHLAVVARPDDIPIIDTLKSKKTIVYRKPSPSNHAAFLSATRSFDWGSVLDSTEPQTAADALYSSCNYLLDKYYPELSITITSRDPPFMTPSIKQLLRQKNSLLRKGLVDRANAITVRIGTLIANTRAGRLSSVKANFDSKDLWTAVREITGKTSSTCSTNFVPGINSITLNDHYSSISHDPTYQVPFPKQSCPPLFTTPSEFQVFQALDHLKPTAPGPDKIPHWFLKIAAPFLAHPLSHLYQQSLAHSIVPNQWKSAVIFPLPKIPQPQVCSDYRPISLTSILSRIFERLLIKEFLYPLFTQPPYLSPLLGDQYAFRPSGSTTSALVSLLQITTVLLETHPYVHVISFDYSKAFDTVRHHSLMSQVAKINIPDQLYNWIIHFLTGRTHRTKLDSAVSPLASINAGVVQGSALGPSAFSLCVSAYRPITPGNQALKYADDMYLIVPSSNTNTISDELNHIASSTGHLEGMRYRVIE